MSQFREIFLTNGQTERRRDGRRGKPMGGWKKEITNELTQVKL